ncbi:hypothetical protein [Parenemella sanctibonifatiensis]|uniref:Uncharacterized protein n=1 Tax=Parenemella sanctibonifatiensis TaxID=2016505 RepID=A0A255E2M1_9ACTN|nr:hypothetical protein [Parenemella sanctibonifatiensis]OYN85818.1 hypothetical protein CGZ92_10310 [Parenemella sanctibonifatiensis]
MTIEASIEQNCTDIDTKARELQDEGAPERQEMADHAQKTIDDIPWYRVDRHIANWWNDAIGTINEWLDKIGQEVKRAWDWLDENVLPWIFGPVYLAQSYGKWQGVAEQTNSTVGGMDIVNVSAAVEWEGAGASAYKESAGKQTEAGLAATTLIQALQDWFMNHLQSLLGHLTRCLSSIVDIIAAVTDAAIQFVLIADPTNWKKILEKCATAITDTITALGEMYTSLLEFLNESLGHLGEVQQANADSKVVGPGGKWPAPAGNIGAEPGPDGTTPPWSPK